MSNLSNPQLLLFSKTFYHNELMPNQKGSILVILVIIILLILTVAGVYFLFIKKPASSFSNNTQNAINDPITNHITFTKPDSWNARPTSDSNHLIFASSDLTTTISQTSGDTNQAIDNALHPTGEQANYNSDITQITISKLKAVSYHNNYEGHGKTWIIVQDPNTIYQIDINSKDQATEDMHKAEIDAFISSITIK